MSTVRLVSRNLYVCTINSKFKNNRLRIFFFCWDWSTLVVVCQPDRMSKLVLEYVMNFGYFCILRLIIVLWAGDLRTMYISHIMVKHNFFLLKWSLREIDTLTPLSKIGLNLYWLLVFFVFQFRNEIYALNLSWWIIILRIFLSVKPNRCSKVIISIGIPTKYSECKGETWSFSYVWHHFR